MLAPRLWRKVSELQEKRWLNQPSERCTGGGIQDDSDRRGRRHDTPSWRV